MDRHLSFDTGHDLFDSLPDPLLQSVVESGLDILECRDGRDSPAGIQLAMGLGDVELAMHLDEEIAEVAGILARGNDSRFDSRRIQFKESYDLNLGMEFRCLEIG